MSYQTTPSKKDKEEIFLVLVEFLDGFALEDGCSVYLFTQDLGRFVVQFRPDVDMGTLCFVLNVRPPISYLLVFTQPHEVSSRLPEPCYCVLILENTPLFLSNLLEYHCSFLGVHIPRYFEYLWFDRGGVVQCSDGNTLSVF